MKFSPTAGVLGFTTGISVFYSITAPCFVAPSSFRHPATRAVGAAAARVVRRTSRLIRLDRGRQHR